VIPEPTHGRTETERATTTFLSELNETAAYATHKKYKLMAGRLKTFAEQRGYAMIDQWEPADIPGVSVKLARQSCDRSEAHGRTQGVLRVLSEQQMGDEQPGAAVKNPRTPFGARQN
jgi:hypothetical protein